MGCGASTPDHSKTNLTSVPFHPAHAVEAEAAAAKKCPVDHTRSVKYAKDVKPPPECKRHRRASIFGDEELRREVTYGNLDKFTPEVPPPAPTPVTGSIEVCSCSNFGDLSMSAQGLTSFDNASRASLYGSCSDGIACRKCGGSIALEHTHGFGSFSHDYEVLDFIGSGGYSKVYTVKERKTGLVYAAKVMETDMAKSSMTKRSGGRLVPLTDIMNEVQVMESVTFPTVLSFNRVLFEDGLAVLIIEKARGLDLYSELRNLGRALTEFEAAQVFVDYVSAIALLHSRNIVHRDLKPENLIFKSSNPFEAAEESSADFESFLDSDSELLLADFGLAWARHVDHFPRHRFCGSALYMSNEVVEAQMNEDKLKKKIAELSNARTRTEPRRANTREVEVGGDRREAVAESVDAAKERAEQLSNDLNKLKASAYGPPVDMWAAGVMLYEIVTGNSPFLGSNTDATLKNVLEKRLPLLRIPHPHLSDEIASLINSLVVRAPAERLTAVEALSHPWVVEHAEERLKMRVEQLRQNGVRIDV
mmetsp:Transcript_41407/g.107267  ORF Transcript_41407/g.107267 Transcript_41407/m.107267 type:complete len:534 (-) Transcript_41407:366-1967(-)